jgi:hypothetical protein
MQESIHRECTFIQPAKAIKLKVSPHLIRIKILFMMASLSITAAFAFMLVIATTLANPVHNELEEKLTLNQDPIKAFKNFWNEEVGKDRSAHAGH